MRNRAKCKKCGDIIESFHSTHLVYCSCGEIGVDGGDALRCMAKDWAFFVRIDDKDKEVPIKVLAKENPPEPIIEHAKPEFIDLMSMLDEMVKTYENLPQNAMTSPITHYDLLSVLLLLSAILRSKES
jgi:hypothetical protein